MSNAKKSAVVLMIITFISKITGFLRDIILAQHFGASIVTDAYITALNIPVVLFTGISASLGTTYIPMYFKIKEEQGQEGVNKFTSNVLNIVLILSFIIIVLGTLFTPYIVKVFAMGFKGEELRITTEFSKILMPCIMFIAANGLVSSYLLANGRFYISGIVSIPFNIICILAIIVGSFTNSYTMVWITLFAYMAQLIFQIPFLKKTGYKHNLKVDVKDNNVRNIIYLIIPVFLGSYVDQINNVINRTLASTLDTGSITALNYANKLNVFAIGILVISISTIMYPILSKFASQNNMKAFKGSLIRCINLVIIIMLPIMVGMMVFATPIVSLLFEGGSFSSRDTFLTSIALLFYALGMVSFGIRDMLSRGFYSLQDTKTPVKNAVAAVFVDIVFSIILVKIMGIGGLALSTSISVTFGAILLMVALRKKIGRLGIKSSVITFLKAITASLIMGLTVNKLYKFIITIGDSFIDEKKHLIFLGLTIATTIGALIYLILSVIFNIKEVKDVLKQLKSRILILLKK
ncbi:murein biosynthesis integral membrane protein MurJ [Paeniclostridium sordellii]|uniref:murein biosynthesis integral membrane protein MurJ n=1 Tax=Paraclostridium sordellii TaxID=1505 RepID=UPI00214A2076|nr:murein biosynthesis integral membrane protein MurJ [Paeniclostridium sordellii]MCR1848655.1 murein biosynthesis integral membrane protein MurJ [Paeniclostridium sordellii]